MRILTIGHPINFEELKSKFGKQHQYAFSEDHEEITKDNYDIVFDFLIDSEPQQFNSLNQVKAPVKFLQSLRRSLLDLVTANSKDSLYLGFNGLPTFFNRPILEVSRLGPNDDGKLKELFQSLDSDYVVVEDRVGLVTARVVLMIINEAFYTYQEGTATKEDIDSGMKLGTNYPYGPFEWCEKIGIDNVYEVLEALYQDTKEERYKIAPLLKRNYLQFQKAIQQ